MNQKRKFLIMILCVIGIVILVTLSIVVSAATKQEVIEESTAEVFKYSQNTTTAMVETKIETTTAEEEETESSFEEETTTTEIIEETTTFTETVATIIETTVVEETTTAAMEQMYVEHQQENGYRSVYISGYGTFKSYERYTALTNTSSWQYRLQQIAYTGDYGIRMYDGRYCIAVGSGVGASGGQYIDLVLENGVVIPCIVGDFKADSDTDAANLATGNGCVSEFIVDMSTLHEYARTSGNISDVESTWNSPVVEFRIYETYAF